MSFHAKHDIANPNIYSPGLPSEEPLFSRVRARCGGAVREKKFVYASNCFAISRRICRSIVFLVLLAWPHNLFPDTPEGEVHLSDLGREITILIGGEVTETGNYLFRSQLTYHLINDFSGLPGLLGPYKPPLPPTYHS